MITRFRVKNYKALRDVTLDLTPIHVLIGPNDSGKTSILDAIAALCRSVDHELPQAFTGQWSGTNLVWRGENDLLVSLSVAFDNRGDSYDYDITTKFHQDARNVRIATETFVAASQAQPVDLSVAGNHFSRVRGLTCGYESVSGPLMDAARAVHDALVGVQVYRWNPPFLALPVAPDAARQFRMEPSGFGLALCLDDILSYDRSRFTELEERFRERFPHITSIKLQREKAYRAPTDDPEQVPMLAKADGKGIYFEFENGGELVPASQVSDGVLLILAYLTVLYLPKPPRLVLVEEPENGIHPKRLQEVLNILRDLVKEQAHSQVILTTHSPYVVDLFEPEEVSLCQMGKDGSVSVHRLSQSKTVREQLDVFTLGEIWTAEGDEALARSSRPDEAE